MKGISYLLSRDKGSGKAFIFSPYLSARSLKYHPLKDDSLFLRFIFFFFLTAASIALFTHFLAPLNYLEIILFAPTIYFFTEAIGAFGQLLFFGRSTFPIHRKPIKATSLSHFWGRDWNLWVQDWLRDVSENIAYRQRKLRIVLVFLISGIFHELMVNLPYWLVFRKSYFGTMMAYFLIQAMALWIDKRWMKHQSLIWRRIFMWIMIIIPSPLFINVPLLTFFGLINA